MKKDFLGQLNSFIDNHRPSLHKARQFKVKNCFGAKAGYWNDKIFISCGSFGLALRLPEKTINNLFSSEEGKPLKYFKRGHTKKDYAVLSSKLLKDKNRIRYLIKTSLEFTNSQKK